MTLEEVLALKVGDRVESRYSKGWRVVEIMSFVYVTQRWLDANATRAWFYGTQKIGDLRHVVVRHVLNQGVNGRRVDVLRTPQQLRPCAECDRAHIYADYLEEQGEARAAAMLRKRFPL